MIARVRGVFHGPKQRVTIILREEGQGVDTMGYVFLPEGEAIVTTCDAAWKQLDAARGDLLVLTLDPKTQWGQKIVEAEVLPT